MLFPELRAYSRVRYLKGANGVIRSTKITAACCHACPLSITPCAKSGKVQKFCLIVPTRTQVGRDCVDCTLQVETGTAGASSTPQALRTLYQSQY